MTNDDPSGIRFERDEHVARVILDRPDRHNALEAVDVFDDDDDEEDLE